MRVASWRSTSDCVHIGTHLLHFPKLVLATQIYFFSNTRKECFSACIPFIFAAAIATPVEYRCYINDSYRPLLFSAKNSYCHLKREYLRF